MSEQVFARSLCADLKFGKEKNLLQLLKMNFIRKIDAFISQGCNSASESEERLTAPPSNSCAVSESLPDVPAINSPEHDGRSEQPTFLTPPETGFLNPTPTCHLQVKPVSCDRKAQALACARASAPVNEGIKVNADQVAEMEDRLEEALATLKEEKARSCEKDMELAALKIKF